MAKRKLSAYNRHMSREMKRGKTFKQAVASWKRGGKKKRSSPKRRIVRRSNPRSVTKTARKRGFLNTSTLMKFARVGALVAPAAAIALDPSLDPKRKMNRAIAFYTGYSPLEGKWSWQYLLQGWLPFVATSFITHGIQKLNGIIRRL